MPGPLQRQWELLGRGRLGRREVEPVDALAHVLHVEVAVHLRRDGWVRVAEDALHGGQRNVRLEQQGGRRVPQVVEAEWHQPHYDGQQVLPIALVVQVYGEVSTFLSQSMCNLSPPPPAGTGNSGRGSGTSPCGLDGSRGPGPP